MTTESVSMPKGYRNALRNSDYPKLREYVANMNKHQFELLMINMKYPITFNTFNNDKELQKVYILKGIEFDTFTDVFLTCVYVCTFSAATKWLELDQPKRINIVSVVEKLDFTRLTYDSLKFLLSFDRIASLIREKRMNDVKKLIEKHTKYTELLQTI